MIANYAKTSESPEVIPLVLGGANGYYTPTFYH